MNMPRLASLLLLSTAFVTPTLVWAQDGSNSTTTPGPITPPTPTPDAPDADVPSETVPGGDAATGEDIYDEAPAEDVDVSIPGGGGIVVTGRRNRNVQRSSPQVVSVLSSEEIARTGDGDIAGSLSRVTGLSVVGNGYVYVRGLGDRYSLALLNGSALPSPEPLKRVVPLDLFPTSIVASALVQKSYSPNFPGEFGGGVINLTTKAIPTETFLTFGGGIGWDTETTNQLGYSYYGGKYDWTGYDNGLRDYSEELKAYLPSGRLLDGASDEAAAIGSTLFTPRNAVVQSIDNFQPNWSGNVTGGTRFDVGDALVGVILNAGYSSTSQTRDVDQQRTLTADGSIVDRDFQNVFTNQRIVANGLFGVGVEWGGHKVRWTNVYIHDTLKRAGLRLGQQEGNPDIDYLYQNTAWYERELFNTQLVGEFELDADTDLNLRGSYAKSRRDAPYEMELLYTRRAGRLVADETGEPQFSNGLDNGQTGDATVAFSELDEDVWSAGADVSHTFSPGWTATWGYAYQLNDRTNSRRAFRVTAEGDQAVRDNFGLLRPDVLFQPGVFYLGRIDGADVGYKLLVTETDTTGAVTEGKLNTHAFYAKLAGVLADPLTFDIGVRWEYAHQTAVDVPVVGGVSSIPSADLKNEYFLPALTLTYEIEPGMQVRVSASKTIARPQFRELFSQTFFDPDGNRAYRGNPALEDSQLYNAEARFEYYPSSGESFSAGGFFKRLDNPIETFQFTNGNDLFTSFANAPKADLYGAELEARKLFDVFADRRLVLGANYTWTKSKLKVGADDIVRIGTNIGPATSYFIDGTPLTGQSEHIANVQIGFEQDGGLSQQTLLLNYATKRVVTRGLNGAVPQPPIVEEPGFTLDFVARQGIDIGFSQIELKFEARNLTGRRHEEYQQFDDVRLESNSYDVGRVFSISGSVTF